LPRDCRTITGLTGLLDLTGRVFLGSALGQRGHGLVDLYGDAFRPRPRSAKGGYSARLEIYAIQPQSFRNSPPLPSPTAAQNVGLFHDMLSPSSHHLCVYLWSRGGLLRDRGRGRIIHESCPVGSGATWSELKRSGRVLNMNKTRRSRIASPARHGCRIAPISLITTLSIGILAPTLGARTAAPASARIVLAATNLHGQGASLFRSPSVSPDAPRSVSPGPPLST